MQKGSMRAGAERPTYAIASVDNALRLLLLFREHPRLRLSDASAYLGVAHSTAHRLLAMLAYHDFVRQEATDRAYVAGPAVIEVGLAAVRNMDLRSAARPVLQELAETFGETVHLSHLEDRDVRYLDAIESTRALRVTSRTGATLPANCTASGKALLAELDPEEVRELFHGAKRLPAATARSITSMPGLAKELREVRRRGFALNDQESEEGVVSVAAAARGDGAPGLIALSVSAPESRMGERRMHEVGRRCRTAAAQLMETLSDRLHL
ncbi:MAG: IclR family transcriptional regulator [Carbonactinosporaceae bacterium]